MIIGLAGLIGSGKGTVAAVLAEQYGFTTLAYADSLKDVLSVVFGWDRAMLEGDTPESRAWRNVVDPWWSSTLGIVNFTPRLAMQKVGTDLFREFIHPDIWVKSLLRKIEATDAENIVVTDCRFFNELEAVRSLGGHLVRIRKGTDPDWFALAKQANTEFNISLRKTAVAELERLGIHPSEYSWVGYDFDDLVNNSSTPEALEDTTHQLVGHLASTLAHTEQSLQHN